MILILGGTSDSVELASAVQKEVGPVLLSTATEYGNATAEGRYTGPRIFGKKDIEGLKAILREYAITALVDATHPFASQVSQNAMHACEALDVMYVRYERPNAHLDGEAPKDIIWCEDYSEAGTRANAIEGNIFITTGSNQIQLLLEKITDWKRLKVRVLPTAASIIKLEELGLSADNIIAVKGPFSEEMNYLMMKESGAGSMICKDSGQQGGTEEKVRAAGRLGIKTLIIRRPDMIYSNKFDNIEAIVDYLNKSL